MMPENNSRSTERIATLFRTLGQSTRLEILLAIGEGEACVCHLEAALKLRQAYISQHLMALRDADVLTTRRDGRFVFYRLADERLLPLIQEAAGILGLDGKEVQLTSQSVQVDCGCPQCLPESAMSRNS